MLPAAEQGVASMYELWKATVKHPLLFWGAHISLLVLLALVLPVGPPFVLVGIACAVVWHIYAGVSIAQLEGTKAVPELPTTLPAVFLPQRPHVLLPRGQKIQVTKEEHFYKAVEQLLPQVDGLLVAATIHRLPPMSTRSTKERVEVRIDDHPVGELSAYMTQQFLPLIRMCEEQGLAVACHAQVKGNQLKMDVVLDAVKGGDLKDEWINEHVRGHGQSVQPD